MTQYNPPPQYGYGQQPQQPFPPGMYSTPPVPAVEPQGPRRYSMFAPWVMWFSPNVWRDVGRRWGGICFFYLLLLQLLTWLPATAEMYTAVSEGLRTEGKAIVDQIPQVTITNGVVSIDKPEPYTVTDPKTGQALMVFDTTGATTRPPANVPSMLLTKNELILRKEDGQIQAQDLSPIKSFQADSTRVAGWLETGKSLIWPVGYPALVIFAVIGRYLQILLYALIGMAIASGVGARLTFGGLIRLSAVVITPIILLDTVIGLFNIPLGCIWTFVGIGIEIALLVFAIRANSPKGMAPPPQYGFPVAPAYPPAQG